MKNSTQLPKVGCGYALASLQVLFGLFDISLQHSYGIVMQTWSVTLNIFTSIFILLFIYRMHQIAAEQTEGSYEITAAKAVGFLFIPFYNLFWLFHGSGKMIDLINADSDRKISRWLFLFLLVSTLVLSAVPFRIGDRLAWYFNLVVPFIWMAILAYLGKKLRKSNREESEENPLVQRLHGKARIFHVFLLLSILSATVLFSVTSKGKFMDHKNLLELLKQIIPLALVAVAYIPVLKKGYVDLSIGSMMSLSGVVYALIVSGAWFPSLAHPLLSFLVAVLITLFLGAFLGALQGVLIAYLKLPSYIVTLGGLFLFQRWVLVLGRGSSSLMYRAGGLSRYLGVSHVTLYLALGMALIGLTALLLPLCLKIHEENTSAKDIVLRFLLLGGITSMAGMFLTYIMPFSPARIGMGHDLSILLACLLTGVLYSPYKKSVYMVMIGALLMGILKNGFSHMNMDFMDQKLLFAGLLSLIALLSLFLDKRDSPVLILVCLGIGIGSIIQLPVIRIDRYPFELKIHQQLIFPVFILIGGVVGRWLWPKRSEKLDDSHFL